MENFINYHVGRKLGLVILIAGFALSEKFDDINVIIFSFILFFVVHIVFTRCPYCHRSLSKRDIRKKRCRHCDEWFD